MTMPAEPSTALLMDPFLANRVEIQDQSLSRDVSGATLAETLLVNLTSEPLNLELRCLFKDPQGVTQETSPWKVVTLGPRERHIYVAPTLNRFAVRFIVQIRSVKSENES